MCGMINAERRGKHIRTMVREGGTYGKTTEQSRAN